MPYYLEKRGVLRLVSKFGDLAQLSAAIIMANATSQQAAQPSVMVYWMLNYPQYKKSVQQTLTKQQITNRIEQLKTQGLMHRQSVGARVFSFPPS